MSTIKKTDDESHPIIEEIYKDIKQTRNTSYIGNFWKYLAFDPNLLKNVWTDIKNIMVKESIIPNKTKEMIYMAVSITNNCSYCTHSHTAAAKKLGMTSEEHSEFLSVIALASKTNQLVNSIQVPVDEIFNEDLEK
ncbi:carboxymuconolactone decarboxylase family protein [Alphaproteobacteria bacterium]|nr:carboxymuconolactone decarboxylase family protein [Alphaproteobacteria bacterium]